MSQGSTTFQLIVASTGPDDAVRDVAVVDGVYQRGIPCLYYGSRFGGRAAVSTQQLDLNRSWGVIRRYRWVIVAVVAVGIAGGFGFAVAFPAMPTATALVVLPPPEVDESGVPAQDIETQALIADSAPVLASAGGVVDPSLRTKEVKKRVRVEAVTGEILEISADGTSARQAKQLANAVAETYVFYVTDSEARLPKDLGGKVGARVLERATTTEGGNPVVHLVVFCGLGALASGVAGTLVILVIARGDRRLRRRDEIADAVGIPVLASLATGRATDVSGWSKLLQRYRPSAVDSWNLRKTLRHLGLEGKETPVSVAVVSFADDPRALAVGPQLAAFAASIGIATELVVDIRNDATAPLFAMDPATVTGAAGSLRIEEAGSVAGTGDETTALRVGVTAVDRRWPILDGVGDLQTTVVSVSAGRVTAEELARVAVAAAESARAVEGIVVADPDPTDRSTGRVPESRRQQRPDPPTVLSTAAKGTRR